MKKTDSKYIVDLIWIVFSLPFVVTDNLVCAKINQLIWDQIPMDFSKLCMLAGLFVVYLLVYRVMVGCFYWRQTRLIKRISTNLKDAVYRYHVYHSKCYAEKDEISNIINHDIPILETDFYGALLSCVICLITAFLAIVMTFSTNFYYGLFCCAAMFISIFWSKKYSEKMGTIIQTASNAKDDYTNFLLQAAEGRETVRHYTMFDYVLGRHNGIATEIAKSKVERNAQLSTCMVLNQNINRCITGVMSLVGFYLVSRGKLTLGWLMAFIQLSSSMTYTLVEAIQEGMKVYAQLPIKKRLFSQYHIGEFFEDFDVENEKISCEKISCEKTKMVPLGIKCHIEKCMINSKLVLQDLDFTIRAGEKLLITGENGSGKTTLLKILLGLNQEFEGMVEYFDDEGQKQQNWSEQIAYVAQAPFVFTGTIKDNILLDHMLDEKKYQEIKRNVNLKISDEKQCDNLQQNVSGGEKQKIEIARAIYSDRGVLIMDEPYSALDPDSLLNIEENILNDTKKTVIVVSHRVPKEHQNLYTKHIVLKDGMLCMIS